MRAMPDATGKSEEIAFEPSDRHLDLWGSPVPAILSCHREEGMQTMTIARRFRGPPNSGNGGYVCGMLARHIPGAAEVALRAPPPLGTELSVVEVGAGSTGDRIRASDVW